MYFPYSQRLPGKFRKRNCNNYNNVASVVDGQGKGHFFEFDYDSAKKEFFARIRTSTGMIKEVWYDKDGDTKRVDVNGRTIQSIAKDGRNLISWMGVGPR